MGDFNATSSAIPYVYDNNVTALYAIFCICSVLVVIVGDIVDRIIGRVVIEDIG